MTLLAFPWLRGGLTEEEITRGMPCTIFRGTRTTNGPSPIDKIASREKTECIWWAPATIIDLHIEDGIMCEALVRDESSKNGRTLRFTREWTHVGGVMYERGMAKARLIDEAGHPRAGDGTMLIVGERRVRTQADVTADTMAEIRSRTRHA